MGNFEISRREFVSRMAVLTGGLAAGLRVERAAASEAPVGGPLTLERDPPARVTAGVVRAHVAARCEVTIARHLILICRELVDLGARLVAVRAGLIRI